MSLFSLAVLGVQPSDVWYGDHGGPYYPAFWTFGKDGVHILDLDGNLMKSMPSTDICDEYVSRGIPTTDCNYYRAISDGRKAVFVTNTAGSAHSAVQAYSMETGMKIADLETCGFPYNIEYLPHREEVWTHCWSPEAGSGSRDRPDDHPGDVGHLDVFSTNALFVDHEQIQTGPIETHGHGTVHGDAAIPNYVFSTSLTGSDSIGSPSFFRIALNKRPKKAVPMAFDWRISPGGFYRFALNGWNKHAYLRSMVCCSCGTDEADSDTTADSDTGTDCSTGSRAPGKVNITTGPNSGTYKIGYCGHSCENSKADVVGMIEYDLEGEAIVAYHTPNHEVNGGNSAPLTSPLGDYIVMMTGGGQYNDILRTRGHKQASINAGSIATGFKSGGGQAVTDVEFIEDDTHNAAIFVATTDNFIVLADMRATSNWDLTGTPPEILTHRINLQDTNPEDPADSSSGHGRGAVRSAVWAPKTDKVIIDSGVAGELHILTLSSDGDISKAKLTKTITGIRGTRQMLYVNNYNAQHSTCDVAYWQGPAKAAGWTPPCDHIPLTGRRQMSQSYLMSSAAGDDD